MQTKERVILHSDVNNFFASVECSTKPELLDKPVAVTGNPKKRNGIILAKNELAKRYGVKTGQVIGEAKGLCPGLVCLPPHYDLYEQISGELHQIYLEYTNFVEPLGLDECWLDVTDSLKYLKKDGKEIADEIRQRVKTQFKFTVSVGVSFSKIFAKLASDLRKPDFTTVISRDNFKTLTYDLPLNSIVGIGHRLEKKFSSIDVKTIGEFTRLEDGYLENLMGINGINLKNDLLAKRDVPVADYYSLPPPKSIGNGTTLLRDIHSREEIKKVIFFLAEKVALRLKKHSLMSECLSITIKNKDLKTFHISKKIPKTGSIKKLGQHGMELCDKIWKYNYPIRAIRLRCSALSDRFVKQMSMFDKERDFSEVTALINQKYGKIELASSKSDFINKSEHPQQ